MGRRRRSAYGRGARRARTGAAIRSPAAPGFAVFDSCYHARARPFVPAAGGEIEALPEGSARRSHDARQLVGPVLEDLSPSARDRALLLVKGFGGTPPMELTLMYDAVRRAMAPSGVEIIRSLVGSYVTSLDMAGCSVTLSLMDDESLSLWDAPVHTAALRWGC